MPLKLVPPREGKSPNWTIRGAHLGVTIDQSARTRDRRLAQKQLIQIREEIERGAFSKPSAATFASAVISYVEAGGSSRFMAPLLRYFGETPLSDITQREVDAAAIELYPHGSAGTRNRQVYAVVSVILSRAGVDLRLKRPKGAGGVPRTHFLSTASAFALLAEAEGISKDFAGLVTFLLYTGCRLSEALALRCQDVDLNRSHALIGQRKTASARTAHLPPIVVAALANLPRGLDREGGKVFALTKCGRLYSNLDLAATRAGVTIPDGVAFHILRHTWATWMRRFGKLDTAALRDTGAWKDMRSAARYEHLDPTEEGLKASMLPVPEYTADAQIRGKSVETRKVARK